MRQRTVLSSALFLVPGLFLTGASQCQQNSDADGDGYTQSQGDCDDQEPAVHPGALELCNGVDDDCSGQIDDGVSATFYLDQDSDGYGVSSQTVEACPAPPGYAAVGGDCDDAAPTVNPGGREVAGDGIDDDCDASSRS